MKTPVPEPLFKKKLPEAGNFFKKETLTQVLSCKFCEILKSTFFHSAFLAASKTANLVRCTFIQERLIMCDLSNINIKRSWYID